MSQAYSVLETETPLSIFNTSFNKFPPAGTMLNGSVFPLDTLERPSLENGYLWLESPNALSSLHSRPAGQSRLESQLKRYGVIAPNEVLDPAFLCRCFNLPLTYLDPSESRPATQLLDDNERQWEIFSTPNSHRLPWNESFISVPSALKALTLSQPWASLFSFGLKHWETRSYRTSYRGQVVICSSAEVSGIQCAEYIRIAHHHHLNLDQFPWDSLPRGYALAIANLTDCQLITPDLISQQSALELDCGHWPQGYYAWKLEDIQPIDPIPIKGKAGLWTFPSPELIRKITNPILISDQPPKRKHGQRGYQKHPPSGHLAPTIQKRKGIFYPRIPNLDEAERLARLHDHPEDTPDWFVWLYQWGEKHPDTGLWRTRSKRVPLEKLFSIKNAISSGQAIAQILKIIDS
jgi:hypothetical protein